MKSDGRDRPIHVAIIDDDDDIREGLRWMIEHSDGFVCIGSFNHCGAGIEKFSENPPDVVLMDIGMPGTSGIECVEKLGQSFRIFRCSCSPCTVKTRRCFSHYALEP